MAAIRIGAPQLAELVQTCCLQISTRNIINLESAEIRCAALLAPANGKYPRISDHPIENA